jgi:hypothetical protein
VEGDGDCIAIGAESLINAHSKSIENYCGRKFIKATTAINEIFDGDGQSEYYVKNWPITETLTYANIYYRYVGDYSWMALFPGMHNLFHLASSKYKSTWGF